nr:hypothetical protein [uncultured Rhodopila sp.]
MVKTPRYERDNPARPGSGVQEDLLPFQHPTADGLAAAAEWHSYDGLDESLMTPTVEQIHRDLLEAREDIMAGRVHSIDDVLAAIDEAFEQGVARRFGQNGDPIG